MSQYSQRIPILGDRLPCIVRLGAVVVPILPDLPEADVHHILNEMKVKLLYTTQRQVEKVYELTEKIKSPIIALDDYVGIEGVVDIRRFSDYLNAAEAAMAEKS